MGRFKFICYIILCFFIGAAFLSQALAARCQCVTSGCTLNCKCRCSYCIKRAERHLAHKAKPAGPVAAAQFFFPNRHVDGHQPQSKPHFPLHCSFNQQLAPSCCIIKIDRHQPSAQADLPSLTSACGCCIKEEMGFQTTTWGALPTVARFLHIPALSGTVEKLNADWMSFSFRIPTPPG